MGALSIVSNKWKGTSVIQLDIIHKNVISTLWNIIPWNTNPWSWIRRVDIIKMSIESGRSTDSKPSLLKLHLNFCIN